MAYHDLTDKKIIPPAASRVLGLSLKFIPTPSKTTSIKAAATSAERLLREVAIKTYFAGADIDKPGNLSNNRGTTKLYIPNSAYQPPLPPREVDSRLNKFEREIRKLFAPARQPRHNLPKFLRQLLERMQANDQIVYCNTDKGLGPAGLELDKYIRWALKHLTDKKTYAILTEEEAWTAARTLKDSIFNWTVEYRKMLNDDAVKFIRVKLEGALKDPFGYFYILPKIHKTPISTRPVCSDCGSLPHPLGQWVDEFLQPIAQSLPTAIKNSYSLRKELNALSIPPNASLFTCDAVSMYTNIDTTECLRRLEEWFRRPAQAHWFSQVSVRCLMEAIALVLRNNRFRFGDLYVLQLVGIAMGMSPAPTLANVFVGVHEEDVLLQHVGSLLLYLKRFIDDGFGIWLHDPDPMQDEANWRHFQDLVNAGGLQWTFSPRAQSAVFLDMTISIVKGKIQTCLYAKPLNLYLYIPPHSCHSPGVLSGLVFGNVLRIFQLCSRVEDIEDELALFMQRLVDRGYQMKNLLPLLSKAVTNAKNYLCRSEAHHRRLKNKAKDSSKRQVYFHLTYHPEDPHSSIVQRLWRRIVFDPTGKSRLNCIKNTNSSTIPIDRLIVCYRRAPNLGNLLSHRKIDSRSGPKVSSYLTRHE